MNLELIDRNTPLPEDMLDANGILKLRSFTFYDLIKPESLRLWCHINGRYGLPTKQLLVWLSTLNHRAIEIGSGSGDLAHHLKIPATDNRQQEDPSVMAYYKSLGQPVIKYPWFVERLDALDAIEKYRPELVIGSWITQWVDPNKPIPIGGGNMYGVKENDLLDTGVAYVLIGNQDVHGKKEIMRRPHHKYRLPFVRSRAVKPELDFVWIFNEGD